MITSTQLVADQLKGLIGSPNIGNRRVYNLLTRFEAAAWYPTAFEKAIEGSGWRLDGSHLAYTGDGIVEAAFRLLQQYLFDVRYTGEALILSKAAEYAKCTPRRMQKAVSDGEIPARHVDAPGNGYHEVNRADLDEWIRQYEARRDKQRGPKWGQKTGPKTRHNTDD